jgi:hypothetical protein
MFLGKAGPFTVENHIHVKAMKMHKALLKNSTQTSFQGGTP